MKVRAQREMEERIAKDAEVVLEKIMHRNRFSLNTKIELEEYMLRMVLREIKINWM